MKNIDDIISVAKTKGTLKSASDYIYKVYSKSDKKVSIIVPFKHNTDKVVFDKGWKYNSKSESFFRKTGKYLLKKGTEFITVSPQDFIIDLNSTNTFGFTSVSIQIRKFELDENWLWISGNKYLGFKNRLRFYFSFKKDKQSKSLQFVKELGNILDKKKIPYKIKIEQHLSDRNENSVLYFNKSDYYLIFIIVHHLYTNGRKKFSEIFRDSNFLFVKTFDRFKGLAFAENPHIGEISFGENISNLIASGIIYENVTDTTSLEKFLRQCGYNHEKLYLNPNTDFKYSFDLFETPNYSEKGIIDVNGSFKNKQISIIHEIAMVIVKHAIIYKRGNKLQCDWLKAIINTVFDDEVDYCICNDDEKIEIVEFLTKYLNLFDFSNSDKIVIKISKIAYESIKRTTKNKEKLNIIKRNLYPRSGASLNTSLVVFQQLMNENADLVKKNLDLIENNLKIRGIVSYLSDDEFNPTQKDYGYAYLGMILLKQLAGQA